MRIPVPPVVDVVIAGAFVAFTVAEALFRTDESSPVLHVLVAGVAMLVRWWAPAAVVAALAVFMLSSVTWWGGTITAGFLTVFAVAIERATRPSA